MGMLEDFELLKKGGFGLLPYGWARSKTEAHMIARSMGFPVALKIMSSHITHKTDFGGVKVGIKNDMSLSIAYDEIMDCAQGRPVQGVLVQKMARKGIELIIGGKYDAQFGHVIMLGMGGVYVEVFRDISARICPITAEDVEEMIDELRMHPILRGVRGQRGIDSAKLKELMIGVSGLMPKENISEIDLNPVIFDEHGYDIVDARIARR
jgi:succinyl-CoA synthetase beta subunit